MDARREGWKLPAGPLMSEDSGRAGGGRESDRSGMGRRDGPAAEAGRVPRDQAAFLPSVKCGWLVEGGGAEKV